MNLTSSVRRLSMIAVIAAFSVNETASGWQQTTTKKPRTSDESRAVKKMSKGFALAYEEYIDTNDLVKLEKSASAYPDYTKLYIVALQRRDQQTLNRMFLRMLKEMTLDHFQLVADISPALEYWMRIGLVRRMWRIANDANTEDAEKWLAIARAADSDQSGEIKSLGIKASIRASQYAKE